MFQRCMYPAITVSASDEGDVLEQKWLNWAAAEQWKRSVLVGEMVPDPFSANKRILTQT